MPKSAPRARTIETEQTAGEDQGEVRVIVFQVHVVSDDVDELDDHQHHQHRHQCSVTNAGDEVESYLNRRNRRENRGDVRVLSRGRVVVFFFNIVSLIGVNCHFYTPNREIT